MKSKDYLIRCCYRKEIQRRVILPVIAIAYTTENGSGEIIFEFRWWNIAIKISIRDGLV